MGLISHDVFFTPFAPAYSVFPTSVLTGQSSIQISHHLIRSTLLSSRKGSCPFKVCFLLLPTILADAHFSKLEVYCRDLQGPLVSHFVLKMETERT